MDTGWLSPSATGDDHNQWTDPTYAYADDNNYAKGDSTSSGIVHVDLSWNGGVNYTTTSIGVTLPTSFVTARTWGHSTQKWGRDWIMTELSNANFRVRYEDGANQLQDWYNFGISIPPGSTINGFEVKSKCWNTSNVARVYYIKLKVYYTVPGPFPTHFRI